MPGETNGALGQARESVEMTRVRRRARGARGAADPRHGEGSGGESPERGRCLAPVTQALSLLERPLSGYLVDWLTLRLDMMKVCEQSRQRLETLSGRVLAISREGEVLWEVGSRENISDGNGRVTVSVGGELTVQGSPAMAFGRDNVFGSDDVLDCADRMISIVERAHAVKLPRQWELWKVTRVDVAANWDFQGLENVRAGLLELRHMEGGRYQLKTAAESVYWSQGSRVRSGKAYAKGPELRRQVRLGKLEIDPMRLDMADRLIRMELSLRAQFMRERAGRPWWEMDSGYFERAHRVYFEQFTGNVEVEVCDDGGLKEALIRQAEERGRSEAFAEAAYRTWRLIVGDGLEQTRAMMRKSTWMRHKRQLLDAGLTWGDFQRREVAGFRSRRFTFAEPVRSWTDLESRCALA